MIPIASPLIDDEEIEEVTKVLRSGFIAQGPKVEQFEEAFADYIGVKHAVATSSGTTALHLALLVAGMETGDEVITTPFSFAATANTILYTGAKPVFVDIQPDTFNLDPEKVQEAITKNTKAIMPVHLYGQPADMDPLRKIAAENDLLVIEDAAQAHGARYKDRMVGSWGDLACFSFYPTKNMTTGEGGMITTDNDGFAESARILRAHGEVERYEHTVLGYNFRMTDIAAAIGLVQLKKLKTFNKKRIENAKYLSEHLKGVKGITLPFIMNQVQHVFHQYTIRVPSDQRDEIIKYLNHQGIGTGIHYPKPIYQQKLYEDLNLTFHCPITEIISQEVISLPVHPALSKKDLDKIVESVKSASAELL